MSTTAAHRRGKPVSKSEATVVVENGDGEAEQTPTIKKATVRRNLCGTGPFDKYWLNPDCCGLVCCIVTYLLHAYGVYTVCYVLLPPWMSITGEDGIRRLTRAGIFNQTMFVAIAVMAIISHFMAMTTDPGAVPPDAKPLPEDEVDTIHIAPNMEALEEVRLVSNSEKEQKLRKLCRRCRAFKPNRAHHCSVCRRCIIKMDHHCPWVNNCVGIGNHKYFLLFVFYTFLSCIYSIVLVIARFVNCSHVHEHRFQNRIKQHLTCLDNPAQLINILGLLVEAVLFGMFTSCMMCDQSDVIFSKLTHIDRMKGPDNKIGGNLAGVTEVFGVGKRGVDTRFRPDWLSPFAKVCFPPSLQDEIMGFCRPVKAPAATELTPTTKGPISTATIV